MQKILSEKVRKKIYHFLKEMAFMFALGVFIFIGILHLLPTILIKEFGYGQEDVTAIRLVGAGVFVVLAIAVGVLVEVYKQRKK